MEDGGSTHDFSGVRDRESRSSELLHCCSRPYLLQAVACFVFSGQSSSRAFLLHLILTSALNRLQNLLLRLFRARWDTPEPEKRRCERRLLEQPLLHHIVCGGYEALTSRLRMAANYF